MVLRYKWEVCILSDECVQYIFLFTFIAIYITKKISKQHTLSVKNPDDHLKNIPEQYRFLLIRNL